MLDLLTRENITLVLSIFGSIGTLMSFIAKRKNLKIRIDAATYRSDLRRLVLTVTFENHSHLPIAITSVSANMADKEVKSMSYPIRVGEYTYSRGVEVIDRKFTYNLPFPADVSQFSAVSGYILFELSPEEFQSLSTPPTLLVRSTRGRVQKIELKLDQIKLS